MAGLKGEFSFFFDLLWLLGRVKLIIGNHW